jgi:hypothetical protein
MENGLYQKKANVYLNYWRLYWRREKKDKCMAAIGYRGEPTPRQAGASGQSFSVVVGRGGRRASRAHEKHARRCPAASRSDAPRRRSVASSRVSQEVFIRIKIILIIN